MHVFVAGATGAVGRRLVPRLLARGHRVTATTRSAAKAGELRALGADAVVLDGLDAAAVGQAVAGARPDAIVHQMTALAGQPNLRRFDDWFATTNELRTQGTQHLLAAAQATGVERFVAQSYTGWTNARTGGPVKTEDDPLDAEPAAAQRKTMAAVRFLERTVRDAPLDGIVLRYGNFYGPGASESQVELVRARKLPIIGSGAGVWSWIHLDDAAEATIAALERGTAGVYQIVDDEPAPVAQWLPYLAEVLGAKPPMRVPVWLGRLAAGEVAVRWMTESRGASNEKAKNALDWRPGFASWRDGFRNGLVDAPAPGVAS
ncbi:NAD-dependent epimerase/dehydratase family protein [Pseudonocardia acaciae]|uniref:NAD-dependent epimerase/dehydratase family protein n=1 Tax=Pseudonocardia acaciae TaxID=551276 RepID=UPI000562C90E|nr:NAD(P)-dependent oxidoreductase [Pseudonocardia acaciae]